MQYFGERKGRVKIQMTRKNIQHCCTLKCLITDLIIISRFLFPKFWLASVFSLWRIRGIRQVQTSCDICARFARYLYSTKQTWIIRYTFSTYIPECKHVLLVNSKFCDLHLWKKVNTVTLVVDSNTLVHSQNTLKRCVQQNYHKKKSMSYTEVETRIWCIMEVTSSALRCLKYMLNEKLTLKNNHNY